jgi:hypothetical protein
VSGRRGNGEAGGAPGPDPANFPEVGIAEVDALSVPGWVLFKIQEGRTGIPRQVRFPALAIKYLAAAVLGAELMRAGAVPQSVIPADQAPPAPPA